MAEGTIEKPAAKERSVPITHFTDAEAGAKEFPSSRSRSYNYFEPAKRRASVYEDVTVDVQPDPERHLTQGWVYSFANGEAGYPKSWTALQSSNWHEFRDPNEEWNMTIFRNAANTVRQVAQSLASAKAAGSYALWSRSWSATSAPGPTSSTASACTSTPRPSATRRRTCSTTPWRSGRSTSCASPRT
jgi:propane 2-monooxygenase small subunit